MKFATVVLLSFATLALGGDPPQGLELDLALKTAGPVQPGERIDYALKLVNRSRAPHKVVRPNEGSESGWREPHVFWTATLVGPDGAEKPVAARTPEHQGLVAAEWWKDVTTLAPATWFAIDRMTPLAEAFDVQEDGKLRIVAHYTWNEGKDARHDPMGGGGAAPADLGGMKGIEPYELVSKPVDIEIRRSFTLSLTPKKAPKIGLTYPLSELVDAQVVSRAGAPLKFEPAEWRMELVFDAKDEGCADATPVEPKKLEPFELAPAASTPLLRSGPLAAGRDVKLKFEVSGPVRLALVLRKADGNGPSIRSEWLEVEVAK
jgi:hypothetical protein